MKKISIIGSIIILFTIFACIALSSGGNANTLYLLNWGEYINQELITKFEQEYNAIVIEETVTSSETMYQKIMAGTTSYDVAIPGDYMVTKLYKEGLLKEIDVNNQELKNLNNYKTMFNDDLTKLREANMKETITYSMPYFWGAYSMIYSTKNSEVEEIVKQNDFKALFDKSLYDFDVKTGMYSTARWAVASYLMSNNFNPNEESFNDNDVVSGIKGASFDVWGDDQLKRKVATGDLDLVFTQLGDFFDALYLALDEGLDKNNSGDGLDGLDFNVYVPKTTAAFFDSMVIPTTTKNEELANLFINFMLDPQNAFENALAVGYSPTLKSVANLYIENKDELYYEDSENPSRNVTLGNLTAKYPFYLNPLYNSSNVYLFEPKDSNYMTKCETIVNQAKSALESNNNLGLVCCIAFGSVVIVGATSYITYRIVKKKHGSSKISK